MTYLNPRKWTYHGWVLFLRWVSTIALVVIALKV